MLFSLVLLSCDKYEKRQKQLSGTWELTNYRFQNQQGLSYYPEASGTLFFENCDDTICAYSVALTYSSPQITGARNETGKYSMNQEGGKLFFVPIVNGADQTRIVNSVLLMNRTDLEFVYTDSLGRNHFYVFER